ncbi:hypothetical protein BH09PSE6_BH09PSE6_03620 [soil metagenome]
MADPAKVLLLAGGIGVTPLKAMAHELDRRGVDFELHYCAKAQAFAAFADELRPLIESGRARFHFDGGDPAKGLDIAGLLRDATAGTHVYYCGPSGFMKACAAATEHWAADAVHSEHFKAPAAAPAQNAPEPGSFKVKLARTGTSVEVQPGQSIVSAVATIGVKIETSCESGLCGTCKVRYLEGDVEHADYILGDDEHREYLTACVSRARSGTLVLDL